MPAHGVPRDRRPAFLVTVDVEGDNAWAHARAVTTRNAAYLRRFQDLCERYRLRPTYLTNWEMALNPVYQEFAVDVLARNAGEVGMHLHAWHSPPHHPLTDDDYRHHPYLTEYPEPVLREKVRVMTEVLEDTFGTKMRSHRAGRFGFNEAYARALIANGYQVDCSVTPGVSLRQWRGHPAGDGGPDYRGFPKTAYFVDPNDVGQPGDAPLLEVPVTIGPTYLSRPARLAGELLRTTRLGTKVANRLLPNWAWMYPAKFHRALPKLLRAAAAHGRDYAEFMIHSSELMPGGSPRYPTARSIEALYRCLERLFAAAEPDFEGLTLTEYHDRVAATLRPAPVPSPPPTRRARELATA